MVEEIVVTKLPIINLVVIFIGYVIFHISIGMLAKKAKKDYENNKDNEELKKKAKILDILFKWFPVGAVLFIILYLLA